MSEVSFFESLIGIISQCVILGRKCASTFLGLITANDVLILFCLVLPLVGLGIGLIRRLVSIRA